MAITFENDTPAELQTLLTTAIDQIIASSPPQLASPSPSAQLTIRARTIFSWKNVTQVYFVAGLFATNVYVKLFREGDHHRFARFQTEIRATIWAGEAKVGPEVLYHDLERGVMATKAIETTADGLGIDRMQRARLMLEKLRIIAQVGPGEGPEAPVSSEHAILTAFETTLDKSKLCSEDFADVRVTETMRIMEQAAEEVNRLGTTRNRLSTGDSGEHNTLFAPVAADPAKNDNKGTETEALLIDWEGVCYEDPVSDVVRLGDFYTPEEQKVIDFESWVKEHYVWADDPLALQRYRAMMTFFKGGRVLQTVVGAPWHPEDWRDHEDRKDAMQCAYDRLLASLDVKK